MSQPRQASNMVPRSFDPGASFLRQALPELTVSNLCFELRLQSNMELFLSALASRTSCLTLRVGAIPVSVGTFQQKILNRLPWHEVNFVICFLVTFNQICMANVSVKGQRMLIFMYELFIPVLSSIISTGRDFFFTDSYVQKYTKST